MSFPTFLLRRMASASVLQKLSQRARDAEEMIGQLKQQIELVKQTAGSFNSPVDNMVNFS